MTRNDVTTAPRGDVVESSVAEETVDSDVVETGAAAKKVQHSVE